MTWMLERNLAFIRQADAVGLKAALLDAAAGMRSGALEIGDATEVSSQFYDMHCALGRQGRPKLERALVHAVMSWKVKWHGYEALAQLILAAGYIQCSEVIDAIRLLIDNPSFKPCASRSSVAAVKHVLSVLGGLGPLARPALERAFYDPRFESEFAAILLNGLCLSCPQNYPRYFRHFLAITERTRPYYDLTEAINEMIEMVRPHVILEHLEDLEEDDEAYESLCRVLGAGERKLTLERGEIALRDKKGALLRFAPRSATANARAASAAVAAAKKTAQGINGYLRERAGMLAQKVARGRA